MWTNVRRYEWICAVIVAIAMIPTVWFCLARYPDADAGRIYAIACGLIGLAALSQIWPAYREAKRIEFLCSLESRAGRPWYRARRDGGGN